MENGDLQKQVDDAQSSPSVPGRVGLDAAAAQVKQSGDTDGKRTRRKKETPEEVEARDHLVQCKGMALGIVHGIDMPLVGLAAQYDPYLPQIGVENRSFRLSKEETEVASQAVEDILTSSPPGVIKAARPWIAIFSLVAGIALPRIMWVMQLSKLAKEQEAVQSDIEQAGKTPFERQHVDAAD